MRGVKRDNKREGGNPKMKEIERKKEIPFEKVVHKMVHERERKREREGKEREGV